MNSEFNLLDEHWIKVLTMKDTEKEISLRDALLHAESYKQLSGEIAAQDIAVLRMMLGLLYSVFARVDMDGDPAEFEDEDDALKRWEELWDNKSFPEKPLNDYFEDYHDRFWLFDEKRPFYQIPEIKKGTKCSAAKLNGAIAESNNKVRMFSERGGVGKKFLTYPEAARWLLYINGFDDTAAKPTIKGLPSPGAGWLGKLGLIEAVGDNLFETLMLNLEFLDFNGTLWNRFDQEKGICACWERTVQKTAERTQIAQPNNFAELMTLQSRRLLLERNEEGVNGYVLLGGDFFDNQNVLVEPMTLWNVKNDKNDITVTPKRHDPSKQIWREFESIAVNEEKNFRPGVVVWIERLAGNKIINTHHKEVRFRIVSVQYGDKDFFVNDEYTDSIDIYASLLDSAGYGWQKRIVDKIELCDKCAKEVSSLSKKLQLAAGGDFDTIKTNNQSAREEFYERIDPIFRQWLAELDPEISRDNYEMKLVNQMKQIALKQGKEMVGRAGPRALKGRMVKKADKTEKFYCSPQEYRWFRISINKICNEGG